MGNLDELEQYAIDRNEFVGQFNRFFGLYDMLWNKGFNITTDNFKVFRIEDEFYILHLTSGTMINWYKHLGRTNTCNKKLTTEEYAEFFKMLYEEVVSHE